MVWRATGFWLWVWGVRSAGWEDEGCNGVVTPGYARSGLRLDFLLVGCLEDRFSRSVSLARAVDFAFL